LIKKYSKTTCQTKITYCILYIGCPYGVQN
jgi:hypothetical protein